MIKYLSKANKKNFIGTALLRLDFNTKNEWRMEAAIPTIRFLLKHCEKLVILSHRGRPRGFDDKLRLTKDAANLRKLLGRKINFLPDFDFPAHKKLIAESPRKSVFVLENLRFLKGEQENDRALAKKLAALAGDVHPRTKRGVALRAKVRKPPRSGAGIYVNDAFAVSPREDASLAAITEFLPSYAGLELEKEIKFLSRVMEKPKKPLVVILGGAKARDKLGILEFFKNKADWFLVGGAAANTLLFLRGVKTGKSLMNGDADDLKKLRRVLGYKNLVLPVDWLTEKRAILDIGGKTENLFLNKIKHAKTIIWSGPLGVVEKRKFSRGTLVVARGIEKNKNAFSIAGGGETVTFLKKHGLAQKFGFVSTGGGAMLKFLAGEKLPGIEALKKSKIKNQKGKNLSKL